MDITPLEKHQASDADQAAYAEIERLSGYGRVPNFYKVLANNPGLIGPLFAFERAAGRRSLSAKLRQLAWMRAAILNGCEY